MVVLLVSNILYLDAINFCFGVLSNWLQRRDKGTCSFIYPMCFTKCNKYNCKKESHTIGAAFVFIRLKYNDIN